MLKKDQVASLQPLFAQRSLEAIRKRIQKLGWPSKETPKEVERSEEVVSININEDEGAGVCGQPVPSTLQPPGDQQFSNIQWRREILGGIREHLQDLRVGATELAKIVEELLHDRISLKNTSELVEDVTKIYFPSKWSPMPPKGNRRRKPISNRQRRRMQYAFIQRMYRIKRKDAAGVILEERWKEAHLGRTTIVDNLVDFWAETVEMGSEEECLDEVESASQHWPIVAPIVAEEVTTVLQGLVNSALGMDRVSAKELLSWHQPSLASFMNILLVMEILPSTLARVRVTFIPKTDVPTELGDFRPIAVTPLITKAFHKILAQRMREELSFSPLQHAFLRRDGCLEAVLCFICC